MTTRERTERTALYVRVSTDGQDNGNQLDELREFAARQRWDIIGEYVDVVSGAKVKRPQFDKMMLAASQRRFDRLLFWRLDRFSREGVLPTLHHLQRLDGYGIAWRSFSEPFFDSCGPFKEAVISIMATLAAQERIGISERTKAGLRRAVKAGRVLGRRPKHVDVVRVRQLQAEGLGLRPVAKRLRISVNTLRQALKSA